MKNGFLLCVFFLIFSQLYTQTVLDEIPQEAYDNYADSYNYTFWDDNFKTNIFGDRKFSVQTNLFSLNVNYDKLNVQSLNINQNNLCPDQAFAESKADLFPIEYGGEIDFAVLQNGTIIHKKASNPTSFGNKDSQLAEYGTWLNRRFVSVYLDNNASFDLYYTGVEFTNWHNRLKMTFHVRPTTTIINGALQFSFEIPSIYNNKYNNGATYGFANNANAGFAVEGGSTVNSLTVQGNTVTVKTNQQNLLANTSYEVSLILYVTDSNLSSTYIPLPYQERGIQIQANQTKPNTAGTVTKRFDKDEGIHYLDITRYAMGYVHCQHVDRLQNIELTLQNTTNYVKRVRLCFQQIPNINVVGFNSLIRNDNGDPSGFPLQVSKNWHTSTNQLYSGEWIREYTEIIVPPNTNLNIDYSRTGAKWGETYSVSSHQLSVVGAGIPKGGWLEAALGSFGESITHSPDYAYGNSNVCDYRPFLVTNQNYQGTSTQCNWTGNVGGMDMWVYLNNFYQRIYQSEVKTRFQRYSPNLTETSVSAITSDKKLKLDYSFFLNRSDDYLRVFYKIKIKALQNTAFKRFDIFQLGSDNYNYHKGRSLFYGNQNGTIGQFAPTNDGSNNYTTSAFSLPGNDPWIWAGDGINTFGHGGLNIDTNNGMIIRSYKARIAGQTANTPYFRERSSSQGFSGPTGQNPTSYCLVTPPGVNSFFAGDSIELIVETVILPKQAGDYYGPNTNFDAALAAHGNSVGLFLREVQGNQVNLNSTTHTVDQTYPYSVTTINNEALVKMTGGKSYVPLIFKGLTEVSDPKLWKSDGSNCWQQVDQSVHGKDFWQADYQARSGTFDLVYNVNQDHPLDATATFHYHLGDAPLTPEVIVQSNYNNQGWTLDSIVNVYLNDEVHFAPAILQGGSTIFNVGTWSWSGPNGFSSTNRDIQFSSIVDAELGTYTVTYTSIYGCTVSQDFVLTCLAVDNNGNCLPRLTVNLTTFLEGPWDESANKMSTLLWQFGILPSGQPFNTAPWNYNGTEGTGWSNSDYPVNTVDWVLVSLRSSILANDVLDKAAGILLEDGTIELLSPMNNQGFNEVYVVVEHRNHLPIMTPVKVPIVNGILNYDFTLSNSYSGSSSGQKSMNGVWMMYAGNVDQSNPTGYEINSADRIIWGAETGTYNLYIESDFNLDRDVNGADRILWQYNNGTFSGIPK